MGIDFFADHGFKIWWVVGGKRSGVNKDPNYAKKQGGGSPSKMGVRTNRGHVRWSTQTDESTGGLILVLSRCFLGPGLELNPNVQYLADHDALSVSYL